MSADNETPVVSAAASADRESTEAGMGMPEALSGGLGVSSPAAPSYTRRDFFTLVGDVLAGHRHEPCRDCNSLKIVGQPCDCRTP